MFLFGGNRMTVVVKPLAGPRDDAVHLLIERLFARALRARRGGRFPALA